MTDYKTSQWDQPRVIDSETTGVYHLPTGQIAKEARMRHVFMKLLEDYGVPRAIRYDLVEDIITEMEGLL